MGGWGCQGTGNFGDTTITQQTIRDCVTQQLYALELDPPPDGVSVERELHLKFP